MDVLFNLDILCSPMTAQCLCLVKFHAIVSNYPDIGATVERSRHHIMTLVRINKRYTQNVNK